VRHEPPGLFVGPLGLLLVRMFLSKPGKASPEFYEE
jgi:hypothetical protein